MMKTIATLFFAVSLLQPLAGAAAPSASSLPAGRAAHDGLPTAHDSGAELHICLEKFCSYIEEGSQRACIERAKLLLEQDAACIHAVNSEGQSPLYHLVSRMCSFYPSAEELARNADCIALLLRYGADPLKAENSNGTVCAADLMAVCGKGALFPLLRERGFEVAPPAHVFTEKGLAEQLMDLPAEAIRTEEIAAAYDLLASLLPPPGQSSVDLKRYERRFCLFAESRLPRLCAIVLPMLHRADAARTQQLLRDILLDEAAWNEKHPVTHALFRNTVMEDEPAYPSPLTLRELADLAARMAATGHPRMAHAFVRLMALDPAAESVLDVLCREETPLALQAAAWSGRLRRAGLPYLGSDDESGVLAERLEAEDLGMVLIEPVRIMDAVNELALSPQHARHIYGDPYKLYFDRPYLKLLREMRERTEASIAALRVIGADMAAEHVAALLNPDTPMPGLRDEPSAASVKASLETEAALGRYIWQHREAISAYRKEFDERVRAWWNQIEAE